MIREAYCSFEVAKLLKAKRFDEPCKSYYVDNADYISVSHSDEEVTDLQMGVWETLRPTHQMACAWLREKGIEVCVRISHITQGFDKKSKNYSFVINDINNRHDYPNDEEDCKHYYPSYEEAVEEAIKYALENLI